MKLKLEQWLQRQWYSPTLSWWHVLTWPFMQLFAIVAKIKKMRDIAQAEGPDVPVIIVGNIHVGGMGKSPVVQALAIALAKQGRSVGVLLRGYGTKACEEHRPLLVNQHTALELAGDEAVMHASVFQQANQEHALGLPIQVVVDPQRVRGAHYLAELGANIIICDDGLQHYQLQRDCEIVVMDAAKGAGREYLLPAGPLREPMARLLEVDLLLSPVGLTSKMMQDLPLVENKLWLYNRHAAMPEPLFANEAALGQAYVSGKNPVIAMAGIANPHAFFQGLQEKGFQVKACAYPDHYDYTIADIVQLARLNHPVIMTLKDSVKVCGLLKVLGCIEPIGGQFQVKPSNEASTTATQTQPVDLINFCRNAFVVPYRAALEDALVSKALMVALAGYERRRLNT